MTPGLPLDLSRLLDHADGVVASGVNSLRAHGGPDADQSLAYDVAHAASALATARASLAFAEHGNTERALVRAFAGLALADLHQRVLGREAHWGVAEGWFAPLQDFVAEQRDPAVLASLAEAPDLRHLDEDFALVQEVFRRFADEQVRPHAEHVHRTNGDIPESVISGLRDLGGFGLSVPVRYGGDATGDEHEYVAMVVATEELSRASLGIGGSLITRPEILTRALLAGGTEEQKAHWLPRLATADVLAAIAVTEPDYGSDVAHLTTAATRAPGGWLLNGVKTWCTFAARATVLVVLARTDPDRSRAHRGLTLFLLEKEPADGHGFVLEQPGTQGRLEGRPIDTLGYRGMHSYEVAITDWFVPDSHVVGGEDGVGQGFYYQMAGLENGRIQTGARARGVMQAAYEAALDYARQRSVFATPIIDYELTRVKLGTMAAIIQCSRQFALTVARRMTTGEGSMEASMAKAYVCRAAEWVTREAMQIHGGMGYAEEFPVSRYFVDARVLSIFEGADETLCLKVISRGLAS